MRNKQSFQKRDESGQTNLSDKEISYLQNRTILIKDPIGAQIIEKAAILNGKTSALLTHVSIMIAISTGFFVFLASKNNPPQFALEILIFEIVVYLILSLFCLISITMSGWNEQKLSPQELIRKSAGYLRIRRMSYLIAMCGTMAATVVLIVTILVELTRGFM